MHTDDIVKSDTTGSTHISKLDSALALVSRGFFVHPLHHTDDAGACSCEDGADCPSAGKHPKLPNWQSMATCDPDDVRAFWKYHPAANIGINPGKSGVLVLDVDCKPGKPDGRAFLDSIEFEETDAGGDPLPPTLAVETPSGGRHLYFKHPDGTALRGHLCTAVEVKSGGANIVGPGSRIGGRSYTIIDDSPIADAPEWLIERLRVDPLEPRDDADEGGLPVSQVRHLLSWIHPDLEGLDADPQSTWFGLAAAVRWGSIYKPDIEQDARDDLLDDWASGRLWQERTGEDPAPSAYKGRDELLARVTDNRRSGRVSGIGSLRHYATAAGCPNPYSANLLADYDAPDHEIPDIAPDSTAAVDFVGPAPEYVEAINRRFAMMTGTGDMGKIVDLRQPWRPSMMSADRFKTALANEKLEIEFTDEHNNSKTKTIPKATSWIQHEKRRNIAKIDFRPPRYPGEKVILGPFTHNIWSGFAVTPKQGDSHKPLIDHIRDNICRGNEDHFQWLMAFLADMVQRPGDKPPVAVAMRGKFGAGKSIMSEYMLRIFGFDRHGVRLSDAEHLTGRFNFHLSPAIYVCMEEAYLSGDQQAEKVLRALVTQDRTRMERKFADSIDLPFYGRIIVHSNEAWTVPAGAGDRRWTILDVDPARKDDNAYFRPLWEALNRDGPAHLLCELLHWNYDRDSLIRPIATAAKADVAVRSGTMVEQWLFNVLAGETLPSLFGDDGQPTDLEKKIVYKDFCAWVHQSRRPGRLPNEVHFWRDVRSILGDNLSETKPRSGKHYRTRVVSFGHRDAARVSFAHHMGAATWDELTTA